MPPKKDDKKKGGAPVNLGATETITEDSLNNAKELPMLDDFVFTNLYAFKMTRNQSRLIKQIKNVFSYTNPEDPNYTEELAAKYRTIDMHQLTTQAMSRGLITENEVAEVIAKTMDPEKRRQVLAQATIESVTAYQLTLRQKKKEVQDAKAAEEEAAKAAAAAEAVKSAATPQSTIQPGEDIPPAEGNDAEAVGTPPPKVYNYEQILYLQDFPQTVEDVQALIKMEFKQLNGVFLVEEAFNRDIEDEEDDDITVSTLAPVQAVEDEGPKQGETIDAGAPEDDGPKKIPEKIKNKLSERVKVFDNIVAINRFLKKQPINSPVRNCIIERVKFEGPSNPMEIPPPPEDGSEPEPIDEEQKAKEFKFYDDFASTQKDKIMEMAKDLQEFRETKQIYSQNLKQLWPIPVDPEEEKKRAEREELRKSTMELKRKEEEEKAAAEAAANKGGKKSQAKDRKGNASVTSDPADAAMEAPVVEEEPEEPPLLSRDDDPSKSWDFFEFKKVMSQLPSGKATVGSMLGVMVHQIGIQHDKIRQEAMKSEYYQGKKVVKKMSTRLLAMESSKKLLAQNAIDKEVNEVFDDIMNQLTIEHSVVETDYKHVFESDPLLNDPNQLNSPYMVVKGENDKIKTDKDAFKFLDGTAQDSQEKAVLNKLRLPGVNQRQGMPEKASLKQAMRDSDCDQIIRFCQLPPSQTKRCLILRAFEEMMGKALKERTFSFLDRNYMEEYKDANTVRQVLINAMSSLRPEMVTEYYPMDDGLLLSIFFKNPPGRLLRRQWTHPVKVLPDFSQWKNLIKQDGIPVMSEDLLDIQNDKVGVIRTNTKFSYPSDNSMMRVDKYNVGQRRFGETQIIRDNFIFGITERKDIFKNKVDGEDSLRNRDAKSQQDKRCDFWLVFENGVRLNIEMQDHLEANMDQLPPSQIPAWLKNKLEAEAKKLAETENGTDDGNRSSLNDPNRTTDPVQLEEQVEEANKTANSALQSQAAASQMNKSGVESKAPVDVSGEKPASDVKSPEEADVKEEEQEIQEEDTELKNPNMFVDGVDMTKGAKLTFTFQEGLIVQILPNGDCMQKCLTNPAMPKNQTKGNSLVQDSEVESKIENQRIITVNGEIIRYMADGNFIIYFSDGSLTYSDKRKGIWYTVNAAGIRRVRKVKDRTVADDMTPLKIDTKIDPETNATVKIREDGVLTIEYIDQSKLIVMPDGTNILRKKRANDEAGTITFITKEGFVPIRQIYDPVKARAKTVIGLGGTDALMGKDNIMERTNTGMISEVCLPDKTIISSYLEKQELEGYNQFSTCMIHLVKRHDFSVVKVRQDGEVCMITANERAFLNEIGKQMDDFGTNDYDYFFEMFGIPNERRSGVYTANLDKGRIWTEDEEGNYFIAYANGDTVEKMSVSFNLDQMVEGIENKEPSSPRIKDGEYIEDECKFLPPPKSMADPRLIYIKNDGSGQEFFNHDQLRHMFRTYHKDTANKDLIQTQKKILIQNEETISHVFCQKQQKEFDPQAFNVAKEFPKLPQCLEMVNQTVSIPSEPILEEFTYKNISEFKMMSEEMCAEFENALQTNRQFRELQAKTEQDLQVEEPVCSTTASLPQSDNRMRSTGGMQSTMMGSNISLSKSEMNSSRRGGQPSPRGSPRMSKKQQEEERKKADEEAIKAAEEAQRKMELEDDEIEIDETTGLQLQKNELEHQLTFMQKLQLRIANERKINISNLKGDEFKVLKEYKKLEDRKHVLNTTHDFFDPQYDYVPGNFDRHQGNIRVAGLENESTQQMMSEHGEHAFYSHESAASAQKKRSGFNIMTVNN